MQTVSFKLTDAQFKRLSRAREKGGGVPLRLNKSLKYPGGTPLILSELDIKKFNDGNCHIITLSRSRIEKMGGLLPIYQF